MTAKFEIIRTELAEIIDLRHRILRAGLPRESAVFAGDELPMSRHYGAFVECSGHRSNVGCATFHLNQWEGEPAWQLRGMATADDFRGQGLGRALLELAEREISDIASASRLWWCNARVPATGFYLGMGWEIDSEPFDIPTAGPHVRMLRRLPAAK